MNELETCKVYNAGSLQALYKEGALRRIFHDDKEVIRAVYLAVRDQDWGTVPVKIIEEKTESTDTTFRILAKVEFMQNAIRFKADLVISGYADNTIEFGFIGNANAEFFKNRIGLNVLLPIHGLEGRLFHVVTPEENRSEGQFPVLISPHQPVKSIKELHWEFFENKVSVVFEGDIFEMEDQRNWTDASYKIYSTPLELPFPVKVKEGEKIEQKISIQSDGTGPAERISDYPSAIVLENHGKAINMPDVGFTASSEKPNLSEKEITYLKELRPSHYRVDIHFFETNWKEKVLLAIQQANMLQASLFLSLHFTDNYKEELYGLSLLFAQNNAMPLYILLFDEKTRATPAQQSKEWLNRVKEVFPASQIGCGVDAYFAEFNRQRPIASGFDFISFAICPQIHADDNLTLIENLEGQKYTVISAKELVSQQKVFISPITLNQRFNVVATSDSPQKKYPLNDERQDSMFNALWTMISFKYLAEAGATLLTFFESVGSKGWMPDLDTTKDDGIQTKPKLYPVYHILKFLLQFDKIYPVSSSDPLNVDSICISKNGQVNLLIANFSAIQQKVKLRNVLHHEPVKNALLKTWNNKSIHEEVSSLPYKKIDLEKSDMLLLAPESVTILESFTI